ncbi:MAG TPA: hypothetical protein VF401_00420 [Candidatus Saccharimonadales bacterium]
MARLPTPGSDEGKWGDILNAFLAVEHNNDGSLKNVARPGDVANVADGSITNAKLDTATKASLTKADNSVQSVNSRTPTAGAVTLTASDISAIPTSDKGATNGVATLTSGTLTAAQIPASVIIKSTSSGDTGKAIDAYTGLPLVIAGASGSSTAAGSGILGESPVIASRGANIGLMTTATLGGGSVTDLNSRISHVVDVDCTDVRFAYQNYQAGTTNVGEASGANSITVNASLELADGTLIPIFFRGAAAVTIAPDGIVVSDPVPVELSKNAVVWSRTHVVVTAGQTAPAIRKANVYWGQSEGAATATTATDNTTGTAISATTNTVSAYSPTALLGRVKTGRPTSVVVIGDSIPSGTGDAQARDADGGYVQRALDALQIPFTRVTRSGEGVQSFAVFSTSRRRRSLLTGHTHALVTYGTNDIFGFSRTLAQVQADLLATWTLCTSRGLKVIQTTITPRTSSSDGWTTVSGQTTTSSSAETIRKNLNAWLRAGSPIDSTTKAAVAVGAPGALVAGQTGHPLSVTTGAPSGYIELADIVESARDSGKFAVPGGGATSSVTGTADTTASNFTLQNASAGLVGYAIVGSGISANTRMINNVAGAAAVTVAPTLTASGVALTAALTGDGIHPTSVLHQSMAAALTTAVFS